MEGAIPTGTFFPNSDSDTPELGKITIPTPQFRVKLQFDTPV